MAPQSPAYISNQPIERRHEPVDRESEEKADDRQFRLLHQYPIQPRIAHEWGDHRDEAPHGGQTAPRSIIPSAVFRLIMPIPALNQNGLLPRGVYDYTLAEMADFFAANAHRRRLFQNLVTCLKQEIRPLFLHPILVDGSFVTDKDEPEDIDIVLDLKETSDEQKWRGLMFMNEKQRRFLHEYHVHFWINFDTPESSDFSVFFQYIGIKTARIKGLDPRHMKGILRIFR